MPSSGLQKHPYTCGRHTKETGWKPELRNYTNSNYRPFEVFLSSLSQILKNISNYKLGSGSLRRAPPSSCCSRVSLGLRTWPKTSRLKSRKDHPFDSGFPNQNQTRNFTQHCLDFSHHEMSWPQWGCLCVWVGPSMHKPLWPISWVSAWDDYQAEGSFPGKKRDVALFSLDSKGGPRTVMSLPSLGPRITMKLLRKLAGKWVFFFKMGIYCFI